MSKGATLPLTWKPLREAAELLSKQMYEGVSEARNTRLHGGVSPKWDKHIGIDWISAQMSLLADLNRDLSIDYWTRYLGKLLDFYPTTAAPRWTRDENNGIVAFFLDSGTDAWMFWEFQDSAYSREWAYVINKRHTDVPGIKSLQDRAALKLALLTVSKEKTDV